jgi:hypothetical protein
LQEYGGQGRINRIQRPALDAVLALKDLKAKEMLPDLINKPSNTNTAAFYIFDEAL